MEFVVYLGETYKVKAGKLNLSQKAIKEINEIKGLDKFTNLLTLNLSLNQIEEIKGLEMLINLKELNLWNNNIAEIKGLETLENLIELDLGHNNITEIKGLGTLYNLKKLKIDGNLIHQDIIEHLGGLEITGIAKKPQKFVEYCSLEKKEQERLEKETIEKIKEMMEVSKRINLDRMQNVLEMDKKAFDNKIFEWARDFNFTIDGDNLIINKETISDFIDALDKQFASWEKGKEKIE